MEPIRLGALPEPEEKSHNLLPPGGEQAWDQEDFYMRGTGIWLAADQLIIASTLLQATCSGEKGYGFVAESTRIGAGRL